MAKISIIVPVYNVESYLADCLDSVLAQTFRDLEVVCVDDGSTDSSPKILADYAARDVRVKVIRIDNGGVSHARNVGLDAATGDIIEFVDADDLLAPEACAEVARAFESTSADVVKFSAEVFPASASTPWFEDALTLSDRVFDGYSSELVFDAHTRPFIWNGAYRASFLKDRRLRFDEHLSVGEDQLFSFATLSRSARTTLLSKRLYRYRASRPGSAMEGIGRDPGAQLMAHQNVLAAVLDDWSAQGLLLPAAPDDAAGRMLRFVCEFVLVDICELKDDALKARLLSGLSALLRSRLTHDVVERCAGNREISDILNSVLDFDGDLSDWGALGLDHLRLALRWGPQTKVTVLVPVYNVERYLDRCLESLAGQLFEDFDVVCINDGSTDGSAAVIERFVATDDRFHVINKSNSGYGASMNRGLAVARGTYVAILESDDFFAPNALELLYNAAEAGKADVAKANFWLYWDEPRERDEFFEVVDKTQAGRVFCPREDLAVFFRKPSIWSALYRRDFLVKNELWFLETPGAAYQDAGFNFKVWATAKRAAFVHDPVVHYRQDNASSSINARDKAYNVCTEYASMSDFLQERGIEGLDGVLERMKFDSYLWNYDRIAPGLRPEFLKCASEEFVKDDKRGVVDWTLFEPGAAADLRALMADPAAFDEGRQASRAKGLLGSLERYARMGGVSLVADVVEFKLFGHSVRRIGARGEAA